MAASARRAAACRLKCPIVHAQQSGRRAFTDDLSRRIHCTRRCTEDHIMEVKSLARVLCVLAGLIAVAGVASAQECQRGCFTQERACFGNANLAMPACKATCRATKKPHRHVHEGEARMPHASRGLSRRVHPVPDPVRRQLRPESRDVHQDGRDQAAGLHPHVQAGIRSSFLRVILSRGRQRRERGMHRIVRRLPCTMRRFTERRIRRPIANVLMSALRPLQQHA